MLNENITSQIADRIRTVFNSSKIILFGSYASGQETRDSDIDLLVIAPTDLSPAERFSAASRALRSLPFAFDVIVKTPSEYERWRKVVNHIVYFADRYGKVIYEQ